MWFIKVEFWGEFQGLIKNHQYKNDIRENISRIKTIENFCKEGKGVSFYNRRTINTKLLKEVDRYNNDINYRGYEIKDLGEL